MFRQLIRLVLPLSLCALITTCTKHHDTPSVQSLLQNRWSVYSESTVVPFCNSTTRLLYNGVAGDYYDFRTNDSLYLSLAGSFLSPGTPVFSIRHYSLSGDNTVTIYNAPSGPNAVLEILKLTADSLTFKASFQYSIANLCTNTTDAGTSSDTLRLYR